MPDIPNRSEHEAFLSGGFSELLNHQRRELATMGIDRAATEEEIYRKQEAETAALAILLLRRPWEEMNAQLLDQLGRSVNDSQQIVDYRAWADDYTRTLARDLTTTNRKVVRAVYDRFRAGEPLTVDDIRLIPIVGHRDENGQIVYSRPATIGVTETTRAASAGEFGAARRYELDAGRMLTSSWVTSRDEAVCKICRPLDGQPQGMWVVRFPMGPPAHVRCRCFLKWRVV